MEVNDGSGLGTFDMFEGVDPAYQAHGFCIRNGLSTGYRNAILAKSCEVAECARSEMLIWWKCVDVSVREVEVEVKEGEEPVDAIFQALQPLDVPFPDRRKVMDAAKSDGVPHRRDYVLDFYRTVRTEDISF